MVYSDVGYKYLEGWFLVRLMFHQWLDFLQREDGLLLLTVLAKLDACMVIF